MPMPRLTIPFLIFAAGLAGCVTPSQEQVEREVGEAAQEQASTRDSPAQRGSQAAESGRYTDRLGRDV